MRKEFSFVFALMVFIVSLMLFSEVVEAPCTGWVDCELVSPTWCTFCGCTLNGLCNPGSVDCSGFINPTDCESCAGCTWTTGDNPPTYSSNSTNSTLAGKTIQFRLKWNDDVGLSKAVLSVWNGSSPWVNITPWCSLSGAEYWCNVTAIVNSTIGAEIWWKQYANDSIDQWTVSENFTFTTTADTISPTYSLNSTNTTLAGQPIEFRLRWDDNSALYPKGQYRVWLDNCTGNFVNVTPFTNFTSTPQWVNITRVINSTVGCTLRWFQNATDDAGNINNTGSTYPFSFVTTVDRWLEVNWTSGSQINSTTCTASQPCEFSQYSIFNANATVKCRTNPSGYSCGNVNGSIRYNGTGTDPNKLINTTQGAKPFYTVNISRTDQLLANTINKAYYSAIQNSQQTPSVATGEFGDNNYNSTNVSDDNRYSTGVTSTISATRYRYNRYTFNLSSYNINQVTSLRYCYEGYWTTDFEGTGTLYYYNVSSASWTSDQSILDTESTLCKSFTNASQMINTTSGLFQFGTEISATLNDPITTTYLYTDFVNLTVKTNTTNPQTCGSLSDNQQCQLNWTVNATGDTLPLLHVLDVNFTSSLASVQENKTDNAFVKITAGDAIAPTYSLNSANSTLAGTQVEFRLRWNDNFGLSKGVLSIDNCTGSFQNITDSWKSFTGTEDWLNYTVVINSTAGCTIRWKQYANDTSNNWNVSEEFSFVTTQLFIYSLKGYALDFTTGLRISSGTVTAMVRETGESNSNSFTNGYWTVDLQSHLDYAKNRFNVGIFVSSQDKKAGYYQVRLGSGDFASQSQACSRKQWHFRGRAIDSETGQFISSGRITVSVMNYKETNTTAFSNGEWDIYFSPCLISGEIYTFQFVVESGNRRSYKFLNQIAK